MKHEFLESDTLGVLDMIGTQQTIASKFIPKFAAHERRRKQKDVNLRSQELINAPNQIHRSISKW